MKGPNDKKVSTLKPSLMIVQSNTATLDSFGASTNSPDCDIKSDDYNENVSSVQKSKQSVLKQRVNTKTQRQYQHHQHQQSGNLSMSLETPPDNMNKSEAENMFRFLRKIASIKDTATLSAHGYKKIRNICSKSLQGQVFEAQKRVKTESGKIKTKRVAIKKVLKELHAESISVEDDMSFVVEEDILKESVILSLLTVANSPPADYIAKFIEFFEDENAFYLVMEYGGNMNLKEFVDAAHGYIKQNRLSLKEYAKMVKYLFWQIMVVINWLHTDMNCCHLDLCLENIVVKNGEFIEKEDGSISINPKIMLKITDFGCAEIFHPPSTPSDNFKCAKTTLTGNYQYCSPQVYENIVYDPKKADIYQLGCILFYISCGIPLYRYQDASIDTAFLCVEHGSIEPYLRNHRLMMYVNQRLIALLNGMLNTTEKQRVNAQQILTHEWFGVYYKKYQKRLEIASEEQQKANLFQKPTMNGFPYYKLNIKH